VPKHWLGHYGWEMKGGFARDAEKKYGMSKAGEGKMLKGRPHGQRAFCGLYSSPELKKWPGGMATPGIWGGQN